MSLRWKERDAIQVKYSTMVCGFAMTRGWAGPGQACPGMPQEVHMNVHTWRHWACIGLRTHSQREGGVAIERLTYTYVHVVCMCMRVYACMYGCYVGRGRKNTEGAATEPAAEKVVHTSPRQRNKKGAEGGHKGEREPSSAGFCWRAGACWRVLAISPSWGGLVGWIRTWRDAKK